MNDTAGLTHENLYSPKNNHYPKKSAALPAAALPFARGTSRFALVASAAADRNREALIKARSAYNQRFLLFLISLEFITSLITKQKISE